MEEIKYRHELKYLITSAQLAVLRARISGLVSPDPHAGAEGKYSISSVYFDDYYNSCYYDNENGTDPREKFRVRIYNHSCDRISLELKRKERGKTLKQATVLPTEIAEQLLSGEKGLSHKLTLDDTAPAILRKLMLQERGRLLHPTVIVEYDRYPYIYKNGNVRITFDTNLCASSDTKRFLEGGYARRPVMPVGLQLMEVKYDEYLPDFIYRALQLENLQQTAYSKYYICRKFNL